VRPLERIGKYVDDDDAVAAAPELAPGVKLTMMFGLGLLAWVVPVAVLYLLW
jgi:hypothetical protein